MTTSLNTAAITEDDLVPVSERKLKNHVSFSMALKNSFTMAHRALLKMLHSPVTFVEIFVMPIIFTLMFAFIFGGAVAGDMGTYLNTLIPGILVMTGLTSCSSSGAALREDMDKGIVARFDSMPISRIAPLAGPLINDFIRYAGGGVIVFVIGYILGLRPAAGILAVLASIVFLMLVAWCLSWLFAFVSLSVRSTSTATMSGLVIMLPLIFLSNAFVPVETLPGWLQVFCKINPISHIIGAVREILDLGTVGADFWWGLLGTAVILLVFIPLTLRAHSRKV